MAGVAGHRSRVGRDCSVWILVIDAMIGEALRRYLADFARWRGRRGRGSSGLCRKARAVRPLYLSLLSSTTLLLLCGSLHAAAQQSSPVPKHVPIGLPTEVPLGWEAEQWRIARSTCQELADRSAAREPISPEIAKEYDLCRSLSFQFDPKFGYRPPGSLSVRPPAFPKQSHGLPLPSPVPTAGAGARVPAQ